MTTEYSDYRVGEFLVQPSRNVISSGEVVRALEPKTMDVFVYLIRHSDRVVSAEELLRNLWSGRVAEESTIHRRISQLRKALGDSSTQPEYIKTIVKRGYQVVADVSVHGAFNATENQAQTAVENVRQTRIFLSAAAFVLFACASLAYLFVQSQSENPDYVTDLNTSIAVLPFANLSGVAENSYFAAGLHEDLLTRLSSIDGLGVISRTSVLRYAESQKPMREIARELSVDYVVEGSVRREDQSVRISIQLIDAHNDRHVWAQTYDRDLSDIFEVQGEITRQVAETLSLTLLENDVSVYSPEVDDLLMEARQHMRSKSSQSKSLALERLRLARTRAPDYAEIHSAIAETLLLQSNQNVSWHQVRDEAMRSLETALQIDPDLASARVTMAQIQLRDQDFAGADQNFQHAIRAAPNDADTLMKYGSFLGENRQLREVALPHLRRAVTLNPNSGEAWSRLASNLIRGGYPDEGNEALQQGFERDQTNDHLQWVRMESFLFNGDRVQALRHLVELVRLDPDSMGNMGLVIDLLCRLGLYDEARLWLDEMASINPGHWHVYVSESLILLHQLDWPALVALNERWEEILPEFVSTPARDWRVDLMRAQADALWRAGDFQEARQLYQKVADFLEDEFAVTDRLGNGLSILEGRRVLWLANTLGHAMTRTDREGEARALLERVSSIPGGGGDTAINRAFAHAMLGNTDAAEAAFREVVQGATGGEFGIILFMRESSDWLNGVNTSTTVNELYQYHVSHLNGTRNLLRAEVPELFNPAAMLTAQAR